MTGQLSRMRALGGFLSGVAVVCFWAPAAQASGTPPVPSVSSPLKEDTDGGRRLLRQMLKAENSVALSGNQVTVLTRPHQEVTAEQRVLRNGTRALRLEYVQPPRFAGEQIVDNGRIYWHYIPSTNTLEVGPSRLARLRGRVPQVLARIRRGELDIQRLGTETVAGRLCAIIQVRSKGTIKGSWRRFWIDLDNGAQLRIEQYNSGGQRISTSYFTNVSYTPTLDRHSFGAPSTPKNVRVVAMDPAATPVTIAQAQTQAGFEIRVPSYLPPAFHFQSASVSDYHGKKLVTLRYLNGLNVMSLFETPGTRPGEAASHVDHPRPNVAQSVQGGVRLILVGNLAAEELDKVLLSLR